MASVADIVVNLVSKTGRFESGMNRGQKKMKGFQKSTSGATKALKAFGGILGTIGVSAGVGGIASLVKQTIDANDELGKMATTLGIATEKLKGIQLAANLAGVQTSALNKGLGKMQKAVVDAANGLTTYQRHFDRIGISTAELLAMAPEEQFKRIGQGLSTLQSQTERIAIAYDIFGGRNIQLINLLTQQAGAMDQVTDNAIAMGAALTGFEVAQFEAAKDNLTLMGVAMEGIRNNVSRSLIPAVQLMSAHMQGVAIEAHASRQQFDGIGLSLARSFAWVIAMGKAIGAMGKTVVAFQLLILRGILAPFNEVERKIRDIINILPNALDLEPAVDSETFIDAAVAGIKEYQRQLGDSVAAFAGLTGEMDKFTAKWEEAARITDEQAAAIQKQRDALRQTLNVLTEHLDNQKAGDEVAAEAAKRQAKLVGIIASTRTQEEKIVANIALLQIGIRDGEGEQNKLIEARTRLVASLLKAREKEATLSQFGIQAARNLQDSFATFFKSMGDGFDDLLKSFTDLLRDMVAELLARKVLLSFFGALSGLGGGIGKFAGSLVSGLTPRALGGPLAAGQAALVGERGPEMFVPNVAGRIIANPVGGNIIISQAIDARGADEARILRVMPAILKTAEDNAVARISKLQSEGRL